MKEQLLQVVEESIKLESNVAELYEIFATVFSEDYDFWKKLSLEEKNHVHLIKIEKDLLLSYAKFPAEILFSSLQNLIEVNNKLLSLLKEYKDKPPSRESAFNIAISLEKSAGEIHFQNAMNKSVDSEYIKIFQRLNRNDKDHARRIRSYMISKGI